MSGVAPGIDSPPSFPEFLLEDVLDYLDLEDLLLVAMPVNRYWRQNVINHRQYWSYLDLAEESPQTHLRSVSLFLLRLSRTEARPISVRIEHADLTAGVLSTLGKHLVHVTFLFVQTSPAYMDLAVEVCRTHPAPLLTDFYLICWSTAPRGELDPVVAPVDMFASTAPLLTHVVLAHVALAPRPQFPAFMANVSSLFYSIVGRTPSPLPNIFMECPRLQRVSLQGSIELEDPGFMQASNWERLREVSINIFGLEATQLPIGGVRRVIRHAFDGGADVVINTAQNLTEPLSVAFHRLSGHPGRTFATLSITMRSTVKQVSHDRLIETILPEQPPGVFPGDTIAAFRTAPLVGTIARLVLAVSNWDELVGLGYLAGFPSLEDLVLTVMHWPPDTVWHTPDPKSRLSCPRLQRLILRRWLDSPRPIVEVEAVASFAIASLPDTTFPLGLELNEVALDGSWKDFPAVFSRCDERELTDLDDNL